MRSRAGSISRYPISTPAGRAVTSSSRPGRVVAVANFTSRPRPTARTTCARQVARPGAGARARLRVAAMEPCSRAAEAHRAGVPGLRDRRLQQPVAPGLDTGCRRRAADVKYPVRWPVSAALADAGFGDSYRDVHPDPVAEPGSPGPRAARRPTREVFDRIDWVLPAGPVTAVDSRLIGEAGGADVDLPVPAPYPSDHRGVVSPSGHAPVAPRSCPPTDRRVRVGTSPAARAVPGLRAAHGWSRLVARPGLAACALRGPSAGHTFGEVSLASAPAPPAATTSCSRTGAGADPGPATGVGLPAGSRAQITTEPPPTGRANG